MKDGSLSNNIPPRWLWRVTLIGVAIVALITVGGAILLAWGLADPPVAGPVIWQDRGFAWAGGPRMALDPGKAAWIIAPEPLPDGAFTLDVSARLDADSDPGAAWGVWLERDDGARVIWAISGEGYFTIRVCAGSLHLRPFPHREGRENAEGWGGVLEDCPAVLPEWRWGPFNRLRPPGETNTITLHQEDSGEIRLRLNDERMGAFAFARTGRWGVWVHGGRESGAVLEWERVTLRASLPSPLSTVSLTPRPLSTA